MTTGRDLREVQAVLAERDRQRSLGFTDDDDFPDGTGSETQERALVDVRHDVQFAEQTNAITWAHILREEVAEALAEREHDRLIEELTQVAAVAVRWAGAIRRRAANVGGESSRPDPAVASLGGGVNPRALHDYLVRLATEAFVGAANANGDFTTRIRERMAQAAQAITSEVETLNVAVDVREALFASATTRAEKAEAELESMRSTMLAMRKQREQYADERDEARAQLAALHAATARFVHSLGDDEEDHPTLGRVRVSRADDGAEENLDRALADLATAAAEHDRRVRAPVEAERDQFAAALAELRDHARTHGYAVLAAALTADLAAQREARIRADERAKALREAEVMLRRRAARAFSAGATAVGLDGEVVRMHAGIYEAMVGEANALVKMADEAERGTWCPFRGRR